MKIAILGASGAIGQAMLDALAQTTLVVTELKLLASSRSAGNVMHFRGQVYTVEATESTSFEGMDVVLGAISNELTLHYLPYIQQAKALFIDNSSALRLRADVPLVVPEINPEALRNHSGIIANPNCSTILVLMAVYRLHQVFGVEAMHVSTYQAVSGAGVEGMKELTLQLKQSFEKQPYTSTIFTQPIAYNVIPQIGTLLENGYTSEEMKMQSEGRKILNQPDLLVNCTCVRVPVLRSHSASVTVRLKHKASLEELYALLTSAKGVRYAAQECTPYYASHQDEVLVGRLKPDLCGTEGYSFSLWCSGDQIRKGAATNAIQILEQLVQEKHI